MKRIRSLRDRRRSIVDRRLLERSLDRRQLVRRTSDLEKDTTYDDFSKLQASRLNIIDEIYFNRK
jgi:hypothetical protein